MVAGVATPARDYLSRSVRPHADLKAVHGSKTLYFAALCEPGWIDPDFVSSADSFAFSHRDDSRLEVFPSIYKSKKDDLRSISHLSRHIVSYSFRVLLRLVNEKLWSNFPTTFKLRNLLFQGNTRQTSGVQFDRLPALC